MPLIDPVTMSNPSSASVPGSISQPITLLGTDLSKVFRHIHPVLLLSIYGQRFSNLIADPVQSLLITLLPIAVVQIAYCAICLPGSGAGTRTPKKIQKSKIGGKKAVSTETGAEKIVPIVFSLILSAAQTPVLAVLQILMGAPLTSHIPETLLSSAHMALLALFPLFYIHGLDTKLWLEVLSMQSPLDAVFGGTLGAVVGAWLGAVPIPLDWDREWQKWPITIVTGSYLGYVVGKTLGSSLVWGKRMGGSAEVVKSQ